MSLISVSAGPVLGNHRRRKRLTLKWLPFLPHLRVKSLKYSRSWKYQVFPMHCKLFALLLTSRKRKKKELTSTPVKGVVQASSNMELGRAYFQWWGPQAGRFIFVSFQLWIDSSWELNEKSWYPFQRGNQKKMCKSPKRRLLNVNTNTSVVKTILK